jgi:DAK2 domain fusion protein YloV
MQTLERLTAADLVAAVTAYRDLLRAHQEPINRLNVFPVPDGDTGTNMALTVESVVRELSDRGATDMRGVADAIAHGSLMGARGNSGVILSQIFRGVAETVRHAEEIDAVLMIEGLGRASDGAYRAVQEPVEGTILSVARGAADGARSVATGASLVAVLDAARRDAGEALDLTPSQLPALEAAGVVDSGGAGFVLLLDAFLHVAAGRPLPECPAPSGGRPGDNHQRAATTATATVARLGTGRDADALRFEVMYLLEAPDESIPPFREVWAGLGESIVVVGGDGLWNCHIHTDDIGAAIEAAIEAGRPHQIRVSDLWEQVEEERWVRDAAGSIEDGDEIEPPPARCAVVAVCTGEGVRRIFRSLGVHRVVSGGQSMNPSTADLLDAIEAAPGEQVVLLTNNKNIVAVAEAAARQAAKPVRVIPTNGIQEGFAALLEYDPEGDAAANAVLMSESASRVVAGEITRAVRDSTSEVGPIRAGDYLGLSRRGIQVVAADLTDAATQLLDRLVDADHHEIITIIGGEGSGAAETRQITEWIAERHPGVTSEVHHGGQPLYPYLFSIE